MKTRPDCLITGCALVTAHGTAWGDLHALGDCYVFNAVLDERGEVSWSAAGCPIEVTPLVKTATFIENPRFDWFERRGVIIMPKAAVQFNPTACLYLGSKR